jgi:hypothetical protein
MARKLLEIIKGRSYRELEDAPTVNNALAVHRALMVECFRYRPAYKMDERVIEVDGNHLLDALMASRGVLSMEQMFLTAKLEAIEPYLRDEGEDWSWDRGLWNTIHFKRTLSDCALEGRILEAVRISETELLRQSKETLEEWIKRVGARDL